MTKFRIAAKKILLTYPKLNTSKQSIKKQLFQNLEKYLPFDYCISQELHKDKTSHFHIYLQKNQKFNIYNTNLLKLKDANNILKSGNYKPVRTSPNAVLRYLVKYDKNPLTNIAFNPEDGSQITLEEVIANIYENQGYYMALQYARHHIPKKDLLKKFRRIEAQLKALHKADNQLKLHFTPLNLKEFKDHPAGKEIIQWAHSETHKTLYLFGASGIGKTEALKTYLASLNNEHSLAFIRHLEQLGAYNLKEIKSILFDDLPLKRIFKSKEEEFIHFLDRTNPTVINIRYNIINLERNKRAVITSNLPFEEVLTSLKISSTQRNAILRRIKIVETNTPFPLKHPTPKTVETLKQDLNNFHPNWEDVTTNTA